MYLLAFTGEMQITI